MPTAIIASWREAIFSPIKVKSIGHPYPFLDIMCLRAPVAQLDRAEDF